MDTLSWAISNGQSDRVPTRGWLSARSSSWLGGKRRWQASKHAPASLAGTTGTDFGRVAKLNGMHNYYGLFCGYDRGWYPVCCHALPYLALACLVLLSHLPFQVALGTIPYGIPNGISPLHCIALYTHEAVPLIIKRMQNFNCMSSWGQAPHQPLAVITTISHFFTHS